MGGHEPEPVVETVRVFALAIGGQLHKTAAALAALRDRPLKQSLAQPVRTAVPVNPHRLDLTAQRAAARKAGDEAQLQRPNHIFTIDHHGEKLVRIGLDRIECAEIFRRDVIGYAFTRGAEIVVGEQADDRLQIAPRGTPKLDHSVRMAAAEPEGNGARNRGLVSRFPIRTKRKGRPSMRTLAILLGGAVVVAACSTNPPLPPPAPAAVVDPNNPLFAPGFLAQAGSANQFEIVSSQLALQASQNGAVRNYANLLISDHTRLGAQVTAAAQSAGLTMPPPVLLPAQQAALDQLRAAGTGPNFDMAYRQAQIDAHTQAIQLMQNYSASGDVPALRSAAAGAIPMMQMHLQQAQMLNVAPPPPPPPVPTERGVGERG